MVGWGGENLDQSLRTQPAPSTLHDKHVSWTQELALWWWNHDGQGHRGDPTVLTFFMLAFADWPYRLEFWILHIKDAYTKQCNECNVMIRRKVMNQIVEAACMQRTPSWRKPDDPRTRAKDTLKAGQVTFCMRKILIRWLLFLSWKLIESIIPGPYVASPMLTRYQNNEA